MKSHWHEQIQLFLDGQLSAQESAVLAQALSADPELRLLYLDYVNLDAALKTLARSPNFSVLGAVSEPGSPRPSTPRWVSRHRNWLIPAAACLALILVAVLPKTRTRVPNRPGIGEATTAARNSISHLRTNMPTPIPSWMSPTAALLDEPDYPPR